jgi:hypothetical protein
LIFGLDAGEHLHDEGLSAKLVAKKRCTVARISLERSGKIRATTEQRSLIVVAAKAADGTGCAQP